MIHWFSDLNSFRRNPLSFFETKGRGATSPLVKLGLGRSVYLVTDPAIIKPILKADETEIDKGKLIHKLELLLGKTSLTISGDAHRERRAIIHRELARGIAGQYVNDISSLFRTELLSAQRQGVFNAHRVTGRMALKVISNILFGPGTLTAEDENALVSAVKTVEDDVADTFFRLLPPLPWVKRRKVRKMALARATMAAVIERARRKATKHSLLQGLESLNLSAEDLRDEVVMLFLGGHHTTGSALAWLMYYIAVTPGLADALAKEAQEVFVNGEADATKLPKAKLSLSLSREVLRLYPSIYWFSRELKRPQDIAGIHLKRGTSLIMSAWHFHRDPRFWEQPEEMRLDRSYASQAYFPFGLGGRACVGMNLANLELQILALEICAAFHVDLVSDYPAAAPHPSVTLLPPDIHLRLQPRETTAHESS